MKVLFHLTVPRSDMAACDAVVQEVHALRDSLNEGGGQIRYLYPGSRPGTRIPRRLWGLPQLPALRRTERGVDLHHIFNPDPFPFALLPFLRRPVLYTAVAGIGSSPKDQVRRLASRVHTLVLPTATDLQQVNGMGIDNARQIGPIFDPAPFTFQPPAATAPFTLLMGSAPWTAAQFQSKGVDALLAAAEQDPDLRLIFLWRGVLFAEMAQKVRAAGLEERVEILNEQVDVNQILARVHATALLVTDPGLIKAHPHSLLESLAAGKPVLVSEQLPLAALVRETGCGLVADNVDAAGVLRAVQVLRRQYDRFQQPARSAIRDHFSSPLPAYHALYETVISSMQSSGGG